MLHLTALPDPLPTIEIVTTSIPQEPILPNSNPETNSNPVSSRTRSQSQPIPPKGHVYPILTAPLPSSQDPTIPEILHTVPTTLEWRTPRPKSAASPRGFYSASPPVRPPRVRQETSPHSSSPAVHLIQQIERLRIDSNAFSGDETVRTQAEIEELWETEPHVTVELDAELTSDHMQDLLDTAIIFYCHNRPPPFDHFRDWAYDELTLKRDWTLTQVKYVGRNFFLIRLLNEEQQDMAISCAPWYLGHRYMYTYLWTPTFDVMTEFVLEVPVLVEFPLLDLILEPHRKKLAESLGKILHYTHGKHGSRYPNDRVSILWETRRPKSERIKIPFLPCPLWQKVDFKTLPKVCSICRSGAYISIDCPRCPIRVKPLPPPPAKSSHPPTSRQLNFSTTTTESVRASEFSSPPLRSQQEPPQPAANHSSSTSIPSSSLPQQPVPDNPCPLAPQLPNDFHHFYGTPPASPAHPNSDVQMLTTPDP
jgi:hypothetical protein